MVMCAAVNQSVIGMHIRVILINNRTRENGLIYRKDNQTMHTIIRDLYSGNFWMVPVDCGPFINCFNLSSVMVCLIIVRLDLRTSY